MSQWVVFLRTRGPLHPENSGPENGADSVPRDPKWELFSYTAEDQSAEPDFNEQRHQWM
jgi:hypothetical protein